ncbi:MAG: hypothetical protein AAB425_15455, partial [Bdellovibrionota bacterium]
MVGRNSRKTGRAVTSLRIQTYVYKKTHRSGSVSWVVRWLDAETGRWTNMAAGKSRDEAQIIEGRIREALLKGQNPRPERKDAVQMETKMTVSELIDLYFHNPRFRSVGTNWQRNVRAQLEKVIRPAFGKIAFADLSKERLYGFYMGMRENGYSNATIRKYHYKFCLLGEVYAELNHGQENPMRKIRDFGRFFPK